MLRQHKFVIKWNKFDHTMKKKKSTQGRMMYLRTFLINNVTKLLFWLLDFQYAKLWLKIRGFLHEHNENINHMDCSLSTAHLFYVNFKLSKWTHLVFGEHQLFFFFFVVQFFLALFSVGMAGLGGWVRTDTYKWINVLFFFK